MGGIRNGGKRTYYEHLLCAGSCAGHFKWALPLMLNHALPGYHCCCNRKSSANFPIVLELMTMASRWLLAQGRRSLRKITPGEEDHIFPIVSCSRTCSEQMRRTLLYAPDKSVQPEPKGGGSWSVSICFLRKPVWQCRC